MRIALLGDVMLGRGVAGEIEAGGVPACGSAPESFFGDTLPLLRGADLVIANLECAVTTHPHPWTRTPKVFHFKAPPRAAEVLEAGNVRAVSLANNHTLDWEEQGLLDTLDHLDAAGIARAGAGRNLKEARAPAVITACPSPTQPSSLNTEASTRNPQPSTLDVGLLAFTDNEPGWLAGENRPGISTIEIRADEANLGLVAAGAAAAREGGARFVILSLHWGPNMRQRPMRGFQEFARAALERGVDLIYGHSAHIFQGLEVCRGKLILYDCGDFLDDYAVDPLLRNDQSVLCFVEVDEETATARELRIVPLRLNYAVVNRAAGEDLEQICGRMQALSRELGTAVTREDSWLQVQLS